jgi:DNA-binding transcriptional regulator YdaS (Cro superfamily)
MRETKALRKAIKAAGGQVRLARRIGIGQTAVSNWLTKRGKVPAERVLAVEGASGVPRHELRPDIYPPGP